MKKSSIVWGLSCGLWIASGSLFAQQYSISTVAGSGTPGWSGDLGPALSAQFSIPTRVALDSSGNIYITDLGNSSIREVFTNGTVNSITGNGSAGFSGDGGSAVGAQLAAPHDIALDASNHLYIADTGNSRIRLVSGGKITTFAGGTRGIAGGNLGDGGQAVNAHFVTPTGVAVDKSGNVYVADIGNATVRKIAPNGIITTIAGTGFLSFGSYQGEGGPATQALLGMPYSLTTDSSGTLYIVDIGLSRLFRIASDGTIHTVQASFPAQNCVIDAAGNIYVAAYANNTVQKILPGGTKLWIAGDGASGYAGDNGPGTSANMAQPYGVAVDGSGNVYVAEAQNAVIRKLTPVPFSIGAISNAATNQPFAAPPTGIGDATVAIAPGEIITIFGAGLGSPTITSNKPQSNGYFGTQVAGTTVTIGGYLAPIIYASSTLVSAIVPYEISGTATAAVVVSYQGKNSVTSTVNVAPTAPGIFTQDASGTGQALAVNLDGTLNSPAHPVSVGGYLIVYETGEGQSTPGGIDGKPATNPYPTPIQTVNAKVNGVPAVVTYAGGAPGFVAGVAQVNVQIPSGVQVGSAQLTMIVNSVTSPAVTITVGP